MSKQIMIEHRFVADVEVRVEERDGEGPTIVGHAAVFDRPVEIFPGFREVVRAGAFAKTIREADIRALFNHDPNYILGRNRASTLTLEEDGKGLSYRISAPETDTIRDLVLEPIKRGDISGSSFSFRAIRTHRAEGDDLRELQEVRLFDVGPVTFPAYPQTDAQLRSVLAECESIDEVALLASLRNTGLTDSELRCMVARVAEMLGHEPQEDVGFSPDLALRMIELEEQRAA